MSVHAYTYCNMHICIFFVIWMHCAILIDTYLTAVLCFSTLLSELVNSVKQKYFIFIVLSMICINSCLRVRNRRSRFRPFSLLFMSMGVFLRPGGGIICSLSACCADGLRTGLVLLLASDASCLWLSLDADNRSGTRSVFKAWQTRLFSLLFKKNRWNDLSCVKKCSFRPHHSWT